MNMKSSNGGIHCVEKQEEIIDKSNLGESSGCLPMKGKLLSFPVGLNLGPIQVYSHLSPTLAALHVEQKTGLDKILVKTSKTENIIGPLLTYPDPCVMSIVLGSKNNKTTTPNSTGETNTASKSSRKNTSLELHRFLNTERFVHLPMRPQDKEALYSRGIYNFSQSLSTTSKKAEPARLPQAKAAPRYFVDAEGRRIIRNCYELQEDSLSEDENVINDETKNEFNNTKNEKGSVERTFQCSKETTRQSASRANPPFGTKTWAYVEDDFDEDDIDEELDLPSVLAEECRFLAGLRCPLHTRCNVSLANHRIMAALRKTCSMSIIGPSQGCSTTAFLRIFTNGERPLEGQTEYKPGCVYISVDATEYHDPVGGSVQIEEGDLLRVTYHSEFNGVYEEDRIRMWSEATVRKALARLGDLSMTEDNPPDLSPMNMAQYCQTLFWNIVRLYEGDVEKALHILAPELAQKSRRRKRLRPEASEAVEAEARRRERMLQRKERTAQKLAEQELLVKNNFEDLKTYFAGQLEIKRQKLEEVQAAFGENSKKRLPTLTDNEAVVASVIDIETGVYKRPMSSLTETQKRVVYHECLRNKVTGPILLDYIENKGRAVLAGARIEKDNFILEYKGQLLTDKRARYMDLKYNRCVTHRKGSFMFYFKYDGRNFAIDSTSEARNYGAARLVNHSRKNPNLLPKTLMVDNIPRLFFVAKKDINAGEELLVDYGERDPAVIQHHPWLED